MLKNIKKYSMTKREAKLIVHIGANYPEGFTEEMLAASIGWPLDEVRSGLRTLVAFGLLTRPCDRATDDIVVHTSKEKMKLSDLLSPEEIEEAERGVGQGAVGACAAVEPPDVGESPPPVPARSDERAGDESASWLSLPPGALSRAEIVNAMKAAVQGCGLDIDDRLVLVCPQEEELPPLRRERMDLRAAAAALYLLADLAERALKDDQLGAHAHEAAVTLHRKADALVAIFENLKATGWAWEDEGEPAFAPIVTWVAGRTALVEDGDNPRFDPEALLRLVREALPTWCTAVIEAEGDSPVPARQIVDRECILIASALRGAERARRPIAYRKMPAVLRRLVRTVDALPGMCVVAWQFQQNAAPAPGTRSTPTYSVTARILEGGGAAAARLSDDALERGGDLVNVFTDACRDGGAKLVLTGIGYPDEAADWARRHDPTRAARRPSPLAIARRAARWRTYRAKGALTRAEAMAALGIGTDDEEVMAFVVSQLELTRIVCAGIETLYAGGQIEFLVGRGQPQKLKLELRERFRGRYQEHEPLPVRSLGACGAGHAAC